MHILLAAPSHRRSREFKLLIRLFSKRADTPLGLRNLVVILLLGTLGLRTLQDIFRSAADQLGIEKKLHARLFRHTAATHRNKKN